MISSTYRRASRPRTHAPGGEGGVQPPLLNTVVKQDTVPPPSPPPAPASDAELLEALRNEGVRVARVIMRDFDSDRIWAALEAYQEADDAGPGLLVWMIREGCEPRQRQRDESDGQAEWLRRRMEIHELRQEAVS